MKQLKKIIAFYFLFCLVKPVHTFSQNMNSPYSVYGIGDIDFRAYNRTNGMASTGLALSSSFYLIDNNPAAIAGLTRSFYLINATAAGKFVQYSGEPITAGNSSNKDFWVKRFGLAIKLNKIWAGSIGISQFSNINYRFTGSKSVDGSATKYITGYEGDGGLNEYYWTNAVSLGKHFSVGLKSSIIAGPINQTETISDEALQSVITTKQQDYLGQARFQTGALYSAILNKRWGFSIGGKFIPKTRMISERTLTVTENDAVIVNDEFLKNDRFYLPNIYAAGIAFNHDKKTTFAIDYTYEDWSSLNIKQNGWRLISSNRFSAGVEFSKQQMRLNQSVEKRYFQLGGFINNTYLQIRNKAVNEFGFTAGMGGALNSNLLYSISAEAGQRGTTQAKLIKENYFQFTLGFSFRDYLFSKGRKYD